MFRRKTDVISQKNFGWICGDADLNQVSEKRPQPEEYTGNAYLVISIWKTVRLPWALG